MGILSALVNLWNDAAGEVTINDAARAAERVANGESLLPHQIAALSATAGALCAQQRDYGYVDIDADVAQAIVSAASVVRGWDYSNEDVGQ